MENALIEEALILTRGNQTQAARMLGMSRGSVQQKYMVLRKAGVKA
nr:MULTISPECIES: helix-turn-helix domain-containing protein [Acinetobacter]